MNSNYFSNINHFNKNCFEVNSKFLNILSFNVRSISSITKFNEFKRVIAELKSIPAIIAVQETWFDTGNVSIYAIEGFSAIHCCRRDSFGGTTVYINKNIKYEVLKKQSRDFVDVIAFSLPDIIVNSKPLIIYSVYRSQKCSFYKFCSKLEPLLLEINNSP